MHPKPWMRERESVFYGERKYSWICPRHIYSFPPMIKVVLSGYRSGTEAEKGVAESSSSQLA